MEGIGMTAAIGGTLLAVVLFLAWLANRGRTRAERQRTEQATKELYAEVDREDQATDPDTGKF